MKASQDSVLSQTRFVDIIWCPSRMQNRHRVGWVQLSTCSLQKVVLLHVSFLLVYSMDDFCLAVSWTRHVGPCVSL